MPGTRHELWEKEEVKTPVGLWPDQPKEWGCPAAFTEMRMTWGNAGPGGSRAPFELVSLWHLLYIHTATCGSGSLEVKNTEFLKNRHQIAFIHKNEL